CLFAPHSFWKERTTWRKPAPLSPSVFLGFLFLPPQAVCFQAPFQNSSNELIGARDLDLLADRALPSATARIDSQLAGLPPNSHASRYQRAGVALSNA